MHQIMNMADTPCQPPGKGQIIWTWAGAGNKGNMGNQRRLEWDWLKGGRILHPGKKGEGIPRNSQARNVCRPIQGPNTKEITLIEANEKE